MLLLIDMGNTRIKWALAALPSAEDSGAPGAWVSSGVAQHADLEHVLPSALGRQAFTRVLASNVAGAAAQGRLEQVLHATAAPAPGQIEWFQSAARAGGVANCYRLPTQLGADRFASVIGARALYPGQPLVVVTCGTATTIDALGASGEFLGGMILPGLGLMARALAQNTAQLPQIGESIELPGLFANNTQDAIISGCLNTHLGAIERALRAHPEGQAPGAAVHCVLSGGAGPMLSPHLALPHTVVDNLVLVGLHAVALEQDAPC